MIMNILYQSYITELSQESGIFERSAARTPVTRVIPVTVFSGRIRFTGLMPETNILYPAPIRLLSHLYLELKIIHVLSECA
jgi:hypothetical protein